MNFDCINLHFIDSCNYSCKHCFVNKEQRELTYDQIKIIVDKVHDYFQLKAIKGRINLAGGEPLLSRNINKIIDYIHSKGIKTSIITNGSLLTKEFIKANKEKIDSIGISVDSLIDNTNIAIGRCCKNKILSQEQLIEICNLIKKEGIRLKINTCISKLNVNEDFTCFLNTINPDRYKVLEMINYKSISNVESASREEIECFIKKHRRNNMVFESAMDMKKSYVIIDSSGCLSTNNLHQSKLSVFEDTIENIIRKIDVDYVNYYKRYS